MKNKIEKIRMHASPRFSSFTKNSKLRLGILLCCFLSLPLIARTRVVSSLADSGPRTLREALAISNPGDTIRVTAKGTIYPKSGPFVIDRDVEILGPGADTLSIDGQKQSTVIFLVASNITANISDLTLTNALNFDFSPDGNGGAIRNLGNLTLVRCVVTECATEFGSGGGIYNRGDLALFQCSISNNRAVYGGGISDQGDLLIIDSSTINGNRCGEPGGTEGGGIFKTTGIGFLTNVTVSTNDAFGSGGGIAIRTAAVYLENCTIVSNRAFVVGASPSFGRDGGLAVLGADGLAELKNTLVAGNTAARREGAVDISIGPDIAGPVISQGWNLIQNSTDAVIMGDLTGNLLGVDPELGRLQDNGGPTLTHALLPGSPAIDAASPFDFPPTDQRGVIRPQDGDGDRINRADIGSFEISDKKGKKSPHKKK